MFDHADAVTGDRDAAVAALQRALAHVGEVAGLGRGLDSDADRITAIALLERLKGAAAAAQARLSVDFESSQRAAAAARQVPARRQGEGIADQIGLARRESPARAAQLLTLARALHRDLPSTRAALAAGEISEYRAQLVARETSHLEPLLRRRVDAELAAAGDVGALGNRQLAASARRISYRLDPHGQVRRNARAVAERHVSVRPAPDTMSVLSALLPVADGVRVYATLRRDAEALRQAGDARPLGQRMADLLHDRVTGASSPTAPVELKVVMTDQALLGDAETPGHHEPAILEGYGVVPADLARSLVRGADRAWLRRLYTRPGSGDLVAMDSRSRSFDGLLREFLVSRDQTCRTPWCDAPVRHLDHVVPVADGGPTTAANGQGLCEHCNYVKESLGRLARSDPRRPRDVITITATGHSYRSSPPRPPHAPPLRGPSRLELWLTRHAVEWQAAAG